MKFVVALTLADDLVLPQPTVPLSIFLVGGDVAEFGPNDLVG